MTTWNEAKAAELGVQWRSEHVFAVENEDWKRQNILNKTTVTHVFATVQEFAAGRAFDFKTQSMVSTLALEVDIILAGRIGSRTSCRKLLI